MHVHASNKWKRVSLHTETTLPKRVPVYDVFRAEQREVVPVLALAHADTPARAAWAATCGHTGRSGCDRCAIRGTRQLADGTPTPSTVFRGYDAPAPTLNLLEDAEGAEPAQWAVGTVQYGVRGKFKPERVEPLLMTTRKHSMRSLAAEEASAEEAINHPLPLEAAAGGNLAADPNSDEERALSAGVAPCKGVL